MTRVNVTNVRLAYGDMEIVPDLSAEIPDAKVTSIIGPNGCGKSTLLRAMARLMTPKRGAVLLDGQAIHRRPTLAVARELGLLPQGVRAPDAITVQDLVSRGRFPHQSFFSPPTDADHRAIERAIELAGVGDLRRRPVDELSGGQRQRAWIAMTLAQDTPIILLDEPTTYLDIQHQWEVLDLIRRLNREEGKTVVMVVHDVNEAASVSDHVIAMRAGRIVRAGAPQDVITDTVLSETFGIAVDLVAHPRGAQALCMPAAAEQIATVERETPPTDIAPGATGLTLGYGKRTVVDALDVNIPPGAVTAIIGPNACGKSTLLRAFARLLKPHAGNVMLGREPVSKLPQRRLARQLAHLSQSPVPPPDVTVEDLVSAGRYPYQRWYRQWSDADERAITDAMHATATLDLRYRPVAALSGGQRQRVWIAMALAQDTPVILLDEPTTFLDLAHQVEVLELVNRLNREEGRTVVMVLHDLHHACRYADHLVAMSDGRIIAEGEPRAIVDEAFVERVFGLRCDVIADPATGTPIVVPRYGDTAPEVDPPQEPARTLQAAPARAVAGVVTAGYGKAV